MTDDDMRPVAPPRCLDEPDGYGLACRGPVQYHSTDPGRHRAFPRCQAHWDARLDRRENSMERYENSVTPPSWFDPMDAGEAWGPDDS